MPLQLPITAAALAPQFAHTTIELLFAIMIWPKPDQAERRTEFMATCAASRQVAEVKAVPGSFRVEMLDLIRDALPAAAFKDEIHDRRGPEGINVGDYFAAAIELDRLGLPVSVKQLKQFMTRPARRRVHPAADIGESQLRDLLREYRPAAHLWAAHFIRQSLDIDAAAPCSLSDIGEFLALSEWVADRLATIKLERRNKPLIGPDLWRVPPGMIAMLPAIEWADESWPEGQPPLPHDLRKLATLIDG